MENAAKKEYDALLDGGELFELFPDFKGVWEKDKKAFIRYHEENEQLLNNSVIDLDDEDDFDYTGDI